MRTILSFLFLLISFVALAQQPKLYAVKNDKGIFVEHKVQPKENWYSVGRLYAISPKDIAVFNGLSLDKGLSIGQALKVPLNTTNFIQTVSSAGIPVYHLVEPKEGLLKVASNHGLSLTEIKKLNNLSSDQINTGYSLIVGYIGTGSPSPVVSVPVQETKTAAIEKPAKQNTPSEQPKEIATKPIVKNTEPSTQPVSKPVVKNNDPANQPRAAVESKPTGNNSINYFSTGYSQQAKEGKEQKLENPTYGVFKSSSGWQDGKYYMLINDVVPGTIVKVSAVESGKTIHAKVLGAVPPGKESEGMQLRLSNAAVAALGIEEGNFSAIGLVWFK